MPTKPERLAALARQITRTDRLSARLRRQSDRLSNVRLITALLGIGITLPLVASNVARGWGIALGIAFAVAFIVVVSLHRRVQAHMDDLREWRAIKQGHIARATLDLEKLPPLMTFPAPPHMLETDLDLARLHQVMNVATTQAGALRLRDWLVHPTLELEVLHQRQTLVRELVKQPLFRDKLTRYARLTNQARVIGGDAGETLVDWLQRSAPPLPPLLVIGLTVLSLVNISLIVAAFAGFQTDALVLPGLLIYGAVFASQFRRVQSVIEDALTLEGALRRLRGVMTYLARRRFPQSSPLATLIQPIVTAQPARRLARAEQIVGGAALRFNPIFWLLVNAVFPWDFLFAAALGRLRAQLRDEVPLWLDVWHELEALSSLAALAYLNPADVFPTIDPNAPALLDAVTLGHPLIPDGRRVPNTFRMAHTGEIALVTGSNMSGKSSFLRALGVNLALAYAGGAVRADALIVRPMRLFTSMRVTDTLEDGISYFYAEVRRLKELLDALDTPDAPPMFYLIDEIFRGTNNRERLIGSRAYIRALVRRNGAGLIATHDLELAALADSLPSLSNYHFREYFADGQMVFDYTLHTGASPTTNALQVMALAGLPVDGE